MTRSGGSFPDGHDLTGCDHRGNAVPIGQHTLLAGGLAYLEPDDLDQADLLVALVEPHEDIRRLLVPRHNVLWASIRDFTAPAPDQLRTHTDAVLAAAGRGERVLVFCMGGHGRTGTFLASLIALAEPETADPIAAIRERHCARAVETPEQAAAVFAVRGEPVPAQYRPSSPWSG